MGKLELEMRIKTLESIRETYLRISMIGERNKEIASKKLQEIDFKIALLIQEKELLK